MWLLVLGGCGLPTVCTGTSDAHGVIDAFWGTLDRRYPLFDVRLDGPWEDVGREACDAVGDDASDEAVFDALVGMARALDDAQVTVASEAREGDGKRAPWPHYDATAAVLEGVDTRVDGVLRRRNDDAFVWGRIGDVGYVAIARMEDFDGVATESLDVQIAGQALDVVLADLASTRALVVDVRTNAGGRDRVALELARHFAGPAAIAWSTAERAGPAHDDFERFREIEVAASDAAAYAGPVAVLTSRGTSGAAETFALAMRVRDDVRFVGEPTAGQLSPPEAGTLPNGWAFTWSRARYRAAGGGIFEAVGVPVDVEVPWDPEALAEGRDPQLDAALAAL